MSQSNATAKKTRLVAGRGRNHRCGCPLPATVSVARQPVHISLRGMPSALRWQLAWHVVPSDFWQRTRGALLTSRPPQSNNNPSARAAAAAYMRAHGASPVAWTACHLYGFTAVSRAHASARGWVAGGRTESVSGNETDA